ncbi:GntR family transcriptional regulator [Cupriavidus plantarum]|uniref:DNA-binding GntR family transcriptional regulator n=1 Tax=Cupriavidus plantarum TaxID=942865 RepID=A0A316ETG9_9BURK|nr:GntR family transcriptional regulator [Cupriavidus plantarum]PWK34293.1 DNA-binding GntR family transcriptional regulator [Cupriavidus plantarum]
MSKMNFAEISTALLDGITTGRFPVGALLPTELEMCEQFGASRYTIRAVLQDLQEKGLVSRRKNVGTRVEASRPKTVFRPTLASIEDLMQFGGQHRRVVQSVETITPPAEIAAVLDRCDSRDGDAGEKVLRISSVRLDGAAPIAWTDVYIDAAYADLGPIVRDTPDVLVSALIESRYGRQIAEIEQDIRASTLRDARIADALGLDPGAAVLRIVRRYLDADGKTFELSVTIHPAETVSVTTRMQRNVR